jgi:hypothetical protein
MCESLAIVSSGARSGVCGALKAEGGRDVFLQLFVRSVSIHRDLVLDAALVSRKIDMPAAEQAVILLEAALHRVKLRMRAEMPLANGARGVASLVQELRHRGLAQRQTGHGALGQPRGIVLMSKPMLIPAGEDARASGTAERMRHIAARAADALGSELVEMRRGDVLAPLETHIRVAEIVGDDEEDVGPVGGGANRDTEENQKEKNAAHPCATDGAWEVYRVRAQAVGMTVARAAGDEDVAPRAMCTVPGGSEEFLFAAGEACWRGTHPAHVPQFATVSINCDGAAFNPA